MLSESIVENSRELAPLKLSGLVLDESGNEIFLGNLSRKGSAWMVACEPHVRTKLRRLFPQVSQRASEVVSLSDNPENARDLIWFMERYPMRVSDDADMAYLAKQAGKHIESELLVHQLLQHHLPPEDFDLAVPARCYQLEAATLMQIKRGLLLADELGLGKSASGICAMARTSNLPVLVVTLSHLTTQWRDEVVKFAPSLKWHILKSGKPYDLLSKPPRGKKNAEAAATFVPQLPDVIICNYHKLNGWAERLAGLVKYVVFDEVQELRHSDSAKYHAAKHIAHQAVLRMGLSATPIYNYGNEFFSVIEVLSPGALGTSEEFHREWCGVNGHITDPKAFGAHLRREGIMLRRTRKEVGRELPPCMPVPYTIGSDKSVLDKIKGSAIELAKLILSAQSTANADRFSATQEFNVIMRQATGIAKAPFVAEFVRMTLASEKKIVLFGWHREVYSIWLQLLAEFKPLLYSGTESITQKNAAKEAFLNGDCRILIISLRSGAGLDGLQQVCRVGVFGELDWSPGVLEQCVGRFFRDGQESSSLAYYLLAEDGCDPIMSDVLGLKRQQIQGVRDPDAELIEALEIDSGGVKRMAEAYLANFSSPSLLQTTSDQELDSVEL